MDKTNVTGPMIMYKNTADLDSPYKAEPVYEGRLKVILLMQVSSHDF